MKRVLIVGSQHGNELLGGQLYEYLRERPIDGLRVDFYLANQRAHKAGVRYVESDMNRSYGPGEQTYERGRAARLLSHLSEHQYDLVLDAHTTTVEQEPCFIAASIDGPAAAFMRACHITNVVVMEHEFVRQSLIGHVAQAVSVEISNSQLTDELFERLRDDLVAYAVGAKPYSRKQVFAVRELLKKTEVSDPDAPMENFRLSSDGFYPVLVGENSYKKQTDYLGFKAESKRTINI